MVRKTVYKDLAHFENYWITVIIGLCFGVFWISLIIWNRLIRERLPRDLTLDQMYSLRYWIVLCLLTTSIIWSIFYIYKVQAEYLGNPIKEGLITLGLINLLEYLQKKEKNVSRQPDSKLQKFYQWLSGFIRNAYAFFVNYIVGSPYFLWRYFHLHTPTYSTKYLRLFLYKVEERCYSYINDTMEEKEYKFKAKLCSLIFIYLPRILAFNVFLYEIAINKRLEYFYIFAAILLIPLIYKSLKTMGLEIADSYLKELQQDIAVIGPERLEEFKLDAIKENCDWLLEDIEIAEDCLKKGEIPEYFIFSYNPDTTYEELCVLEAEYNQTSRLFSFLWALEDESNSIWKLIIALILSGSFGIWLSIIIGWY